jgi:hypothetical protein
MALAGCSGVDQQPDRGEGLAAALDFSQPMDVATTPDEPNEFRGFLRVGWGAQGALAIESESEPDLARRTIAVGDDLFTTATGMGWVAQPLANAVEEGRVSNRLVLWDLRGLLSGGDLDVDVVEEGDRLHITGRGMTGPGKELEVTLDLVALGTTIESAEVDSPQGREGPFHFRPATGPMAFAAAPPSVSRSLAEVRSLDGTAYEAHAQVIQLVQDYAAKRAGVLPDRVDPSTLNVELLASGGSWPKGAYDGQAVHDGVESGHFTWTRCGVADGLYLGYGWDGPVITQSFGAGCA